MSLDREFNDYFKALDRSNNDDRCFLCRRTPSDVKEFFGFHEDGTPIDADRYGIEDVVLDPHLDIMSYKAERPLCSICQLNYDAIFMSENGPDLLRRLLWAMEHEREKLWTPDTPTSDPE
jgi:hypothetical protein